MVLKLRSAKGIINISTTLKTFLKKRMKVASQLKKDIKEVWDLLFSSKKKVTKTSTKDKGLFSALVGTFQDENICVINNGASSHMTRQNNKLKTLSKGISESCIPLIYTTCVANSTMQGWKIQTILLLDNNMNREKFNAKFLEC